jgi:hypothetical protein
MSARAASVGVLCYPSSAPAFITQRWIDFAPRSHRLHCAIACRTIFLSRIRWRAFRRRLFQLRPFKREDRQPEYDRPTAFRLGPGNVRCFQPSRSLRPRNKSRSLILIPALRVKSGTGKRDRLAAPAPRPARHFTMPRCTRRMGDASRPRRWQEQHMRSNRRRRRSIH